MKYYLIIGYQLVGKHKNFPTVRVQVNGQLVDEFVCDNEQSTEISSQLRLGWHVSGECGTINRDQLDTITYTTPAKCKIIELDSSTWLDYGELVLSVCNNYSNYNNGFMTKKSQVWFTPVLLIRKDLFDHESVLYGIIRKTHHTRVIGRHDMDSQRRWDSKVRHKWPGFNTYRDRRFSNKNTFTGNFSLFRGGNFEIKLAIKKKHKTHMLVEDDVPLKGYYYIDRFFEAWYQHHKKNYFEMGVTEETDHNSASSKLNIYLKGKSKQINISDENS